MALPLPHNLHTWSYQGASNKMLHYGMLLEWNSSNPLLFPLPFIFPSCFLKSIVYAQWPYPVFIGTSWEHLLGTCVYLFRKSSRCFPPPPSLGTFPSSWCIGAMLDPWRLSLKEFDLLVAYGYFWHLNIIAALLGLSTLLCNQHLLHFILFPPRSSWWETWYISSSQGRRSGRRDCCLLILVQHFLAVCILPHGFILRITYCMWVEAKSIRQLLSEMYVWNQVYSVMYGALTIGY